MRPARRDARQHSRRRRHPHGRPAMNNSIIRVGDGRGFIVEDTASTRRVSRIVMPAAHCLPDFPPATAASFVEERTYKALLGPLGQRRSVCAECLFADPIADLAVLGSPQGFFEEARKYEALVEA